MNLEIKTASRRVIWKKDEATCDEIGNKIADAVAKSYIDDKITKTASWSAPETTSQADENLLEIPKCVYIYIYIYIY